MHVALTAALLATASSAFAASVGIVPDGGTATSVSGATGSHQTVNIAPATGGVSHNTYTSFNVSKAGADLNNVGVNARTIVNQVTSTNPSLIEGAVSVLGPRANVILANPNGITVNGGSFVNAGHVVLSTGQMSFNDITLAPGSIQRDVVLTTNGGTITIGPGGLTGTLVNLDLIAKQLAVNGPVTNAFTSSTSGIRAIVGDSTNEYDTGLSPADNTHDWLISSTSPGTASNAIAVDITPLGGLTAGRIELIVNDKGAGVRNLGSLYATAGDAVVSANGDVSAANASITAAGNVQVKTTGQLSLQQTQMTAGNDVTLDAGGNVNAGGSAISATRDIQIATFGAASLAGSQLTAGNNLTLEVADGLDATDSSLAAAGNLQIATPGAVSLQGTQVIAGNDLDVNANGITLSDDATGPSSVIAKTGSVTLTSSGDISNTGSTIQAGAIGADGTPLGGDVILNAARNITNRSTPANLGIIFAANGATTLTAGGDITNENARVLANGDVTLAAQGDVNNIIDHTSGTNGGAPLAYSDTGGRFLFFKHKSSGFDVDYGTVSEPDQLAWIRSGEGAVSISGRNVTNSGGVIDSDTGAVTIHAQDAFTNAAVFSGQAHYAQSCFVLCHGSASSDVTPYGGTIEAGGDVSISAGTVARNIGGTVYAQGDIRVDAPLTYAQGVTGYSAINQDRGFKAFFGDSWAQIIAMDVGGGFTADGTVTFTGQAVIDGGYISGAQGTSAAGGITTVRAASRTPVQIGHHLGLTTWWWY